MQQVMVIMTAASLALSAASARHEGYAAHYSPGLMQRVAYNQGLPVVDCMVASPYYPLGTWVTVSSQLTGTSKICRVTDVAHPRDRDTIIRRGIVVELDFTSATQLCRISKVNQRPPRDCPVRVKLYTPPAAAPAAEPEIKAKEGRDLT